MRFFEVTGIALALVLAPGAVVAQAGKLPDPADPAAPVPPVRYISAFSAYQAYREEKVAPWRQVHDEVASQGMAAGDGAHGSHGAPANTQAAAAPAPAAAAGGASASQGAADAVRGQGRVQQVDKANGKIKLAHEPIEALGWPKMTMFFRLKDAALADQVKEGDQVEFFLEKSGSGYEITRLRQTAPGRAK